jgi:peroxiredoxin Q/BCP
MRSTLLLVLLSLTLAFAAPAAADLSVGDAAPPFELSGSDGKTYTLADLLESHHGVVLAWFPKAFTPG